MCKIGVEICCFILKLADLNSSNKIGADADGCLKWQPCFRQNGRASRRCSELEHPNLSSRIWELCLDILTTTIPGYLSTFGEVDGLFLCMCLCKQILTDIYIYTYVYPARFRGSDQLWWRMNYWDSLIFTRKRFGKNIWMDIPAICSTWDFLLLLKHGRNTWCIHPVSWACFVFQIHWGRVQLWLYGRMIFFFWDMLVLLAHFKKWCIILLYLLVGQEKIWKRIILDVSKHKLHHSDWWNDVEFMILFFFFRFALEVNGLVFSNNVPEIWKAEQHACIKEEDLNRCGRNIA